MEEWREGLSRWERGITNILWTKSFSVHCCFIIRCKRLHSDEHCQHEHILHTYPLEYDKWHKLTEDFATVKEHTALLSSVDSPMASTRWAPNVTLGYIDQSVSLTWETNSLQIRYHWLRCSLGYIIWCWKRLKTILRSFPWWQQYLCVSFLVSNFHEIHRELIYLKALLNKF